MAATRALAFVSVTVLLLVGAPALFHSSDAGAPTTSITNETWTPDAGTYVALENSNLEGTTYNDTVEVHDENGTLVDEGTDYEWNSSIGEGTIKAVAGGELDGDANATISYRFNQPSGENLTLRHGYGSVAQALPFVIPVFVVGMFVVAMRLY